MYDFSAKKLTRLSRNMGGPKRQWQRCGRLTVSWRRQSTSNLSRAMEDLTLSDGTFIPKGTHMAVPTYVIHRDSAVYENPGLPDPL
ncbi:hypothetical protein EV401DRAFT_1969004 [Pisolithus croceorrhizus]|nr:hypothetical protein EV401DRAFT_1969004 [Pisolithus croceorrhizus]